MGLNPLRQEKCGVTGKDIFSTKLAAWGAVSAMKARGGHVRKISPKRCVFCEGYHMASGKRDARSRGR